MRILHLSDFHYKSAEKDLATQNLLVEKLLESIPNDQKIDYFLFTGDLVFSGTDQDEFAQAYNSFLKKIGEKFSLPKANVLICPGNHDVDRKMVSEPLKKYIRDFKTSDQITKFIEDKKEDEYGLSIKPTQNWHAFEKDFYKKGEEKGKDEINPLFSVHFRTFERWQLGFVCINTAWCSTGDDDRNNLFFPKSELEKAIEKLNRNKVHFKFLLLHHPLTDLRDFNKVDIEDLIYSEFHFMFSGHLHKREDFIRLMQSEGIFGTYAHAAFTKKEDGKVGYSIFDIDLDTLDIVTKKFIYDFEERVFLPLKEMHCTLPLNETKKDQIKIFKTLRKRLQETVENANEIFVDAKGQSSGRGFIELFVDPVLKKQPQVEATSQLASMTKVDLKSLYEFNNYIVYGKDKTGKTSLLYKLMIEMLNSFNQLGEIPFYIDLNEYKVNAKALDLVKLFSRFIEHSNQNTKTILSSYNVKILIDNFDPTKPEILKILSEFFSTYKKCRYVIVADQTLAQSYEKIDFGLNGYQKLFIHDISRTEIRQLTKKWPNIPDTKQDEFVDKIVDVLKQHSMPFNFWTLSIFLWIYSGKNTLNFNNNSELLELYIDDILDRNKLAGDPQNRFSYQNYKLLLSELAHELLINNRENNYSIKYSNLITFTENFKSQNLRRVGNSSEIVSYLLERGILKKIDDDYITFRLNGVFEYFIAYNFIENKEFLEKVLHDDNFYLSFRNEFEIYSGFQRSENENREFLSKIFNKTKSAFQDLNSRMEGSLDLRLGDKLKNKPLIDLSQPITEIVSNSDVMPLTENEKDEFLDEMSSGIIRDVEVQQKKVYDVSIKKFDILEKYLLINGRVFRNVENIKDPKLISEIFDFVIDSACNLGFLLIEEMEASLDEAKIEELDYRNPKKLIFQIINNYLPNVVQSFVQEAIGHINLEAIINSKIVQLRGNASANQYKLFILHCLLLDTDLKKYKNHIDDVVAISKMGLIKSSMLAKLFYLLMFKSYDDDKMIAFLKEKIRQLSLDINPKTDMQKFDRTFEKTRKLLLLKRQQTQ